MIKGRFDSRGIVEIVEELKTERTKQGDAVGLRVKFNGSSKPNVWLEFKARDAEMRKMYATPYEEISSFIPDELNPNRRDDLGGEIPDFGSTYFNWRDYIELFLKPQIDRIITSGGRGFVFEEINQGAA